MPHETGHRFAPRRTGILAVAAATTLTIALATPLVYPFISANAAVHNEQQNKLKSPNFADIVTNVKPSVVNISTSGASGHATDGHAIPEGHPLHELFKRHFGESGGTHAPIEGQGSGFIVSADGRIVTNHHVIAGAQAITATLDDGRRLPARLLGSDPKTDLAVLQIDSPEPLPFVSFGNSDAVRAGDWVLAIGNPFGLGGSVTAGIVSARGRDIQAGPYDDFIQVDAPINKGNSGGPLFDAHGQVIGINTAIFSPNGGSVGIAFAIPAALARSVVSQLAESGAVQRGWLGVQIQALNSAIAARLQLDEPRGALVVAVTESSPAAAIGLRPGDVILSAHGESIESPKDLSRVIAGLAPETEIRLTVWHRGETQEVAVTVGAVPSQAIARSERTPQVVEQEKGLGLALAPLSDENRARYAIPAETTGSLVISVEPRSAAAAQRIRAGDIVIEVEREPVKNPTDVVESVRNARVANQDSVLLLLQRDGVSRFVALPLV